MKTYTAQPGSSPQGNARSARPPSGIIMNHFSTNQTSRMVSRPSYNDEWVAGYKARHRTDGSRARAPEPELLPCVWNIPHG